MQYDGMENNPDRIIPDPYVFMNDEGMRMCVNVITASRPNYLYVCLDGIFRNTVFQSDDLNTPDVYVYVDVMPGGKSYAPEILKVVSEFPVRGVFINKQHKGIAAGFWDSFSDAFDSGYDFCVSIEEDWLITTDALQWLYNVPKVAAHYSLYRWTDKIKETPADYDCLCSDGDGYTRCHRGKYLSWCSAFTKHSFEFIHGIIKAGGLWGLLPPDLSMENLQRIKYADWDRALRPILEKYELLTMIPPVSLLAHFGSQTCQYWGYGDKGDCHDLIFGDDRTQWLENLIQMFRVTTDEEKEKFSFRPFDFEYR